MASEIRTFAVTIPAGTPIAAPSVQPVVFPPRIVTAIRWKVPPGPGGLMGWALTVAGHPVIPIQQGAYFVTDAESDTWTLENYPDQGQWQLTGYNTDIYDHTVYLTFLLDLASAAAATPDQIPNADLSGATFAASSQLPAIVPVPALSA